MASSSSMRLLMRAPRLRAYGGDRRQAEERSGSPPLPRGLRAATGQTSDMRGLGEAREAPVCHSCGAVPACWEFAELRGASLAYSPNGGNLTEAKVRSVSVRSRLSRREPLVA